MHTAEIFLIALAIIFTLPRLVWRVRRAGYAPPAGVVPRSQ
jgi:hypothetical protein